jgi:hypothetical protein
MTGQATWNERTLTNFTTNWLHNIYVYYTMLLHVSAIHPNQLQGDTSLVGVYSAYGNCHS